MSDSLNTIHFIGVGGIGMSALARMMLARGKCVSGSDVSSSVITDALAREGVEIYTEQRAENITDTLDAVVYTHAVSADNPELTEARRRGIAAFSYPEMLGKMSRDKKTVAVAGTHGKTTTTAMLVQAAVEAGLAPSAIVGSLMSEYGTNFLNSMNDLFVVEACEYMRSFLELEPQVLVITNIEEDHLDYYRDLSDIQSAFRELAERVPEGGAIVCNPADKNMTPVLEEVRAHIIDYTAVPENQFKLIVPGAHNARNAQAALAAARVIGADEEKARGGINGFPGTWRRFEYKGETASGALVYDDYAHHPTEIKATLAAAREKFPERRIIAVFQPHLYSRTRDLMEAFAQSFADADEVLFVPIYPAREKPMEGITHEVLAEKAHEHHSNVRAADSLESATEKLRGETDEESVVFTIGAGDIFKAGELLLNT